MEDTPATPETGITELTAAVKPAIADTAITAKPLTVKVAVQTSPGGSQADPHVQARWLSLAAAVGGGVLLWMCYHPLAWGTYLGWVALVPLLLMVRSQVVDFPALEQLDRFVTRALFTGGANASWWLRLPLTLVSLVACVPVKILANVSRGRGFPYFCAWVCGTAFFWPALQWMRVADYRMYATWAMLAFYCSLYFPAALLLLRWLDRGRIPLVLTVPLVWAALEYLRSFLMTGFSWYFLAHTQHDFLPMIQIADFGGVYVVTFLVAAANAFLFDCAYQFPEVRDWFHQSELEPHRCYSSLEIFNCSFLTDWTFRRNLFLEAPVLAALLIGAYAYGDYRLKQNPFTPGPVVCLLQSNLDQRIRNDATKPENNGHSAEVVAKQFAELCNRVVHHHRPAPHLIIWPETSYPREWVEISPRLPIDKVPKEWRRGAIDVAENLKEFGATYTRIPHLLGMNANLLDENGRHRRFNSALFLNAKGEIEGRFDKMHRIPFGEYVPLKDWLPFMNSLAPYDFDYSIQAGEKFTRFPIDKHRFGVLICYEDSDPFLARRYMETTEDGPPVDFLVNISNDGWFDGTAEHEEHLAVSRFRAIECRRSLLRACNMGVSALIDGNGRVLKPTPASDVKPAVWVVREKNHRMPELPLSEWRDFKQVAGVLTVQVPIDGRGSLYPRVGDVLPIGCWVVLFAGAGWGWCQRRRFPV